MLTNSLVYSGCLYMILPVWRFNNLCLMPFLFTFKAFLNLYTSFMWAFPHRCCKHFEGKNCIVMRARKNNQTWVVVILEEKQKHVFKKRLRILGNFYVVQIFEWCSQNLNNSSGTVQKRTTHFSAQDFTSTTFTAIGHHSFLMLDLLTVLFLKWALFYFFIPSL